MAKIRPELIFLPKFLG